MKKLFALLVFCGISTTTMADGEYPNAMVVHLTNGTEKIYFLQDTRLSFKFNGFNWQLTINDSESLMENDIENIAYEYRSSDGMGIRDVLNTGSTVEVFSIDGKKVGFSGLLVKSEKYSVSDTLCVTQEKPSMELEKKRIDTDGYEGFINGIQLNHNAIINASDIIVDVESTSGEWMKLAQHYDIK